VLSQDEMNLDELMKQKELLQQKLGLEGEVLFETALTTCFSKFLQLF
jgi:hypothetical protein